jgi:phosphoglycerate dehydrogenase-like enzyme
MASFKDGGWQVGLGRDLAGATLGIIGLGRLGSLVASYGKTFGMRVIAWSQNLTAERAAEAGVEAVDKETLFRESDFVTIHVRLSDRTEGLVNGTMLGLMKPDAWIVNTSRGPIIDRAALLAALKAGQIGGAALDVFDEEPLPAGDELRRLDNVVATPHVGYVSRENYAIMYRVTAENIAAFLAGKPQNVIEP